MVDEAGANIETLHRNEYSLGASTGELHILVRQAQVAAAADALALEPPYRFRVTLALVEPSLAEVRQFGSLPRELRESSIDHRIDPAKLERDSTDLPRCRQMPAGRTRLSSVRPPAGRSEEHTS